MKNIHYETLTREKATEFGEKLISLSDDLNWDNWTINNLLIDLPGKWSLSIVAVSETEPIGYAIASQKENSLHLHHIIVGQKWRNFGIGKQMICLLAKQASELGLDQITLKIYKHNKSAFNFYTRNGFQYHSEGSGELVWMHAFTEDILRI